MIFEKGRVIIQRGLYTPFCHALHKIERRADIQRDCFFFCFQRKYSFETLFSYTVNVAKHDIDLILE